MTPGRTIRPLGVADAGAAVAVHAAMPDPWDGAAWRRLLADEAVFGFGAYEGSSFAGVVLARTAADEAEILTIAVRPERRRRGIGGRLLSAVLAEAGGRGASKAFLEVAVDNAAAIGLYRQAGFAEAGRRSGYYRRETGTFDALILHRLLKLDDAARRT